MSQVTFSSNVVQAGTITATADETVPPTPNVDNITVNVGATVQSTGGDIIFNAGDNIVVNGNLLAADVYLTAGYNNNDGEDAISLGGSVFAADVVDLSTSNGAVTQTGGYLQAGTLQSSGVFGSVILNGINNGVGRIGNFVAHGSFSMVDDAALSVYGQLSAANISLRVGGSLHIDNVVSTPGSLSLDAPQTVLNYSISNVGSLVVQYSGTGGTLYNYGNVSVQTTHEQEYHYAVQSSGLLAVSSTDGGAIRFYSTVADGAGLSISTAGAGAFDGVISGAGGFAQSGTGTTTLSASNTYTGATAVNAGTLVVDGSIANSTTTVNSGATLGGEGRTGAVEVLSGGTIAPGDNRPGILGTGNLTLDVGSTFAEEIGGTSPGNGSGHYDQLDVVGNVSLTGANLSVTLLGSFAQPPGTTYTIINNEGSNLIQGTFAGLSEGAIYHAGDREFRISYIGGTGNDVTLTAVDPISRHAPADWQDILGDLHSDVLLRNSSDPQSQSILFNSNGTAAGASQVGYVVAAGWAPVATLDLNGNTYADILYMNPTTRELGFYEGGGATFGQVSTTWRPLPQLVPNDWVVVGTHGGNSDFTGDGGDDLLIYNTRSGELGFWDISQTGTTNTPVTGTPLYGATWHTLGLLPAGWEVEGTGDFNDNVSTPLAGNGSHIDDILLRNVRGTNEAGIWEMTGQDTSATSHIAQVQWYSVGAVDPSYTFNGIGNFVGADNFSAGRLDEALFRSSVSAPGGGNNVIYLSGDGWAPSTVTQVTPTSGSFALTLNANETIAGTGDYDLTGSPYYDDVLVLRTGAPGNAAATPNSLEYHSDGVAAAILLQQLSAAQSPLWG